MSDKIEYKVSFGISLDQFQLFTDSLNDLNEKQFAVFRDDLIKINNCTDAFTNQKTIQKFKTFFIRKGMTFIKQLSNELVVKLVKERIKL